MTHFLGFRLLLVAALVAAASPPTAGQPAPIARLTCGGYEAVPSGTASNGQPTRLGIQRGGRLLFTVGDYAVTRLECRDAGREPTRQLVVSTWSGGAHCCETVHVWALEAKAPRKLLEFSAGNAGGFEFRDLDGDGREELLLGDDAFAYFGDLCYACSPSHLPMVACATEKGFQDCTRKHPDVLRAALARYTARLAPVGADNLATVEGAALGVFAVASLLGEEDKARATIDAAVHAPEVLAWLERARPQVRDWMAARGRKIKAGPDR